MGYEIDFLPVGEGERSGDAIALRLWRTGVPNQQAVIVIDGGTKETGQELVDHIKKFYSTTRVDLVIASHSDSDHTSGLTEVLEQLSVKRLWMHLPWKHASQIEDLFRDPRVSADSVKAALRKSLENARELEALATKKNISIVEPFSNSVNGSGPLFVLSPSTKYYESLLPYFRGTPEAKEEPGRFQRTVTAAAEAIKRLAENWGVETLTDPKENETSAENNSSVVLLVKSDDWESLFTADAGVPALTEAANYADASGIDLKKLTFVQVPHHGSKHNVGPAVLNRILGVKKAAQSFDKTSYVSAAKDGEPKHPAKKVVNAFKRRGAEVYVTQGKQICHFSKDAPARKDWVNAVSLPFFDQVDE
jgi:beta-lactamase superfamily II metal-dependent hydrolase